MNMVINLPPAGLSEAEDGAGFPLSSVVGLSGADASTANISLCLIPGPVALRCSSDGFFTFMAGCLWSLLADIISNFTGGGSTLGSIFFLRFLFFLIMERIQYECYAEKNKQ